MDIELRAPVPGDIGWIISEHGKLYSEEFGFDSGFEWDIAEKILAYRDSTNNFDKIFIVYIGNKKAASIAVMEKPDNKAFINFLLVQKEYRRKGLAEMLISHVIDYARLFTKESISLETFSILENARRLYQDKGFSLVSSESIERYGRKFDQEFWELIIAY